MDSAALRIEIAANCALNPRSAGLFFALVCLPPSAIAGFLTLQGYWPVLPFAGLELAALGWALRLSLERRFQSQTITVSEADVSVDTRARGRCERVVFPRHWAQVKLRRSAARLHPSRLTIESHGRRCELGRFLTEAERRGLAARLQRVIGRINESPAWH